MVDALERAVQKVGSQAELARRLINPKTGKPLTQMAIRQWFKRGRVPHNWCRPVEEVVEGEVTRYELRPDVFGDPPQPPERVEQSVGE